MATNKKTRFASMADDILGESLVVEETPRTEEKKPVGRPKKTGAEYVRTTFILNQEQIAKVKAISAKEGFPMKDIIEKALGEIIDRYEAKNGVLTTSITTDPKNIDDIF